MIGTIFIIIAVFFVYRTAKQNGYRPGLWAVAAIAIFFGIQVLVAVGFGIAVLIAAGEDGFDALFARFSSVVGIASSIAGAAGVMLVLRHVNQIPDEHFVDPPPPPSTFGLD